jgi:hypothetical protein
MGNIDVDLSTSNARIKARRKMGATRKNIYTSSIKQYGIRTFK